MNLIIYSIAYPEVLPDGICRALLSPLPGAIKEAVGKYKRRQNTYGCLFGKHLLLAALRDMIFKPIIDCKLTSYEINVRRQQGKIRIYPT